MNISLLLYRMMTAHIAHGADILVLSVLQLLLKGFQLRLQDTDISVDMMNILLDAINLLLTLVYLHRSISSGLPVASSHPPDSCGAPVPAP